MRHQMPIPQLQDLLEQYRRAREAAGFFGPNDVILQIPAYVADSAERARSDPEASIMHRLKLVQRSLGKASRLARLPSP